MITLTARAMSKLFMLESLSYPLSLQSPQLLKPFRNLKIKEKYECREVYLLNNFYFFFFHPGPPPFSPA